MKKNTIKPISAAVLLMFFHHFSAAHDATTLNQIVVHADKNHVERGVEVLNNNTLKAGQALTSDTAALLQDVPGVNVYTGGGVSSLPVIHGLADDRLRIKVDGMDFIASCPNHMNSPLSYVDPTQVGTAKVYTTIAPVSVSGDSIGGAVIVDSKGFEFATPEQGILKKGELGTRYRSNGNSFGGNASAQFATDQFSLLYSGSTVKSDNYKAGGHFKNYTATGRTGGSLPMDEVGSTAYKATNHLLGMAMRSGNHLIETKLSYQDIPYELYPNQRMDLLGNTQKRASIKYKGLFNWGNVEARAYHEQTDHYMDFGADKKLNYGSLSGAYTTGGKTYDVIGMPMYTKGKTTGISLKSEVEVSAEDTLRLGLDVQQYRLDDWWPPSPNCGVGNCYGGMAPLTFLNINNGKRDRNGLFAEWESQWNKSWLTLFGARFEQVRSDTGAVEGYFTSTTPLVGNSPTGMPMPTAYETSSVGTRAAFNTMNRKRIDNNIDLVALARYTPDENREFEFGLAQKTRSPSLYERYSWSRAHMALEMNNFVGDGNGYLGNPDLKPEIAHTLSATGDWHSADRDFEFKATPYYTRVKDYIDAVQWNRTTNVAAVPVATNQFVTMKYMNQLARIYGLDLYGKMPIAKTTKMGEFVVKGLLNYTNGKNQDTGSGLYNIMPLNVKLSLNQKINGWSNAIELIAVKGKTQVSDGRNEIKTPGYSLVNLRSNYTWRNVRFDFGVENILNKMYYLPLGGAYTGQGSTMSFNKELGSSSMWGTGVPGMGRSIYAGINVKF
jgi:iron complex outermembrane recepter protein